jgi:hypothetical protein
MNFPVVLASLDGNLTKFDDFFSCSSLGLSYVLSGAPSQLPSQMVSHDDCATAMCLEPRTLLAAGGWPRRSRGVRHARLPCFCPPAASSLPPRTCPWLAPSSTATPLSIMNPSNPRLPYKQNSYGLSRFYDFLI